ncbi:MAG: hypothetical protein E7277_02640 [Lachnospiraceae bacterium]|nr:hypothetical protein [Lachnospiraceae bacterium]
MRKIWKQVLAGVAVFAIVCTLCPGFRASQVEAASTRSKMCKLTKEFVNFAGLECSNDKWLGKEKKYVFSSKATRRAIATYAVYDGTHHDMSYYSKKMFGKGVGTDKEITMGDWGNAGPVIKVNKYTRLKNGRTCVNFTLRWTNEEEKTTKTLATGKLYLKKKSGAYYGYVATKMVLARTNEEFR